MFTAKILTDESLRVDNRVWNETLRMMYNYTDKNLESDDVDIQNNIKKMVEISSNTCYNHISPDEHKLFLPIPHDNGFTVLLLKVEYPDDERQSILLVDVAKDLALLAKVGD